jgi:PIN domain nuclease of toxin-antitoxin system
MVWPDTILDVPKTKPGDHGPHSLLVAAAITSTFSETLQLRAVENNYGWLYLKETSMEIISVNLRAMTSFGRLKRVWNPITSIIIAAAITGTIDIIARKQSMLVRC